ncbi:hypothetical protein KKC87_04410 [Patescibacteria group bacterium]|nr:hypothetical protein [Patescibacteria group bacterium]
MAIVTIEVEFEKEELGIISTSQLVPDSKAIRMLFSVMPQRKELKKHLKNERLKEESELQPQPKIQPEEEPVVEEKAPLV